MIEGAVETLMKPLGIPSLNFSYHIITWSWVLAGNHIPGLFPIEVQKISVAEEHIKKVKLIEKVTVKFSQLREISRLLNIRLLKERMAFELSMTPVLLCWYASIGDIQSIKEMIKLGVDLNIGDYDKRTALHLAAGNGELEVLKLLIDNKADLGYDFRKESAF